ncbi:MAG: BatA domain-containing protein [Pirellulaceae bacterium]|nr:BatA domain-containing protein [Pirellulaceae bacterium]
MSFLAPLYALGLLAISAPILFHLIQRRPKGEQTFSSLMFLKASPPRLTRRSRLDNLLLLLLRGLALLLLASAFARPFLRSYLQDGFVPSREVVVLLDTSASMKRPDLWKRATDEVAAVVDDLLPTDRVALLAFDNNVTQVIGLENHSRMTSSQRSELFREKLKTLSPSWLATDLGKALPAALELLHGSEVENEGTRTASGQIVLITDFQVGSSLKGLDGIRWPPQIGVDLRQVVPIQSGNASLHRLHPDSSTGSDELLVRVTNTPSSSTSEFELKWLTDEEEANPQYDRSLQVPPNQQRSVRVKRHPSSRVLTLSGDHADFDNQHYIARSTAITKQLLHLGIADNTTQSLDFFLHKLVLDTPRYSVVSKTQWPPANLETLDPIACPLVVISQPVSENQYQPLRNYLTEGGRILFVLETHSAQDEQMSTMLANLLDLKSVQIDEAIIQSYAMFGYIDFQHSLFAPFADPRFNDFTKIRIWKHRYLSTDHESPWDILASFDNKAPALVQRTVGQGTAWILTTGWQPSESQLALSTKFLPLVAGMFDDNQDTSELTDSHQVGSHVDFAEASRSVEVVAPDGERFELKDAPFSFDQAHQPGIYQSIQDGQTRELAFNIALTESQLDPLDKAELEQRGLRLEDHLSGKEIVEQDRQLRDIELESQQQMWRWLILGALGLLIAESWLGGRLGRRANRQMGE